MLKPYVTAKFNRGVKNRRLQDFKDGDQHRHRCNRNEREYDNAPKCDELIPILEQLSDWCERNEF